MTHSALAKDSQASLTLVLFQRLLALGILVIVVMTLLNFPIGRSWLAVGLSAYFILLWRYPWIWLIVVPTLLPVLDLTPTTGRIFFGEFDLLILLTCAAGLMRREGWTTPLQLNWKRWSLIILLIIWQGFTALKGLLPIQPFDANAFTSYYSHYNSLRLAKGFFWALLLLPLLGQAIGRGNQVTKLFILGMIGGLTADLTAILWERSLFTGIFNFTKPYRVTALFSGMTTGGAPLDAHLIFSLPFVGALFLVWSKRRTHIVGFALLLFSIYGLAVTFSRADYAAVLVAVITGLIAWITVRRQVDSTHHGKGRYLLGIILLALFITAPFISGEFIKHRFTTVSADLSDRFVHWNSAIDMMGDDLESQLLGMGRGAFPRSYYWSHPPESLPPTMLHVREESNEFLRMERSNDSGDLFLTQRFDISEPGPYRLSISLRPRKDKSTRLLIEICERLIFQSYKPCRWVGIDTGASKDKWVNFNKKFSVNDLGMKYWYGSRPVQVSILNRGLTDGLDIDDVQIYTPSGKQLLNNNGFQSGLDHWFFYSGNHLGWHIKNIWVDTFFEGGWIGFIIFSLFIASSLIISIKRLRKRDIFPLLYIPALSGLLVIGLFDSILDEPKLTLLLFLCTWIVLAKRSVDLSLAPVVERAPGFTHKFYQRFRKLTPVYQILAVAFSSAGFLLIALLGATQLTGMGPRQLGLRVLDKMGQQDGYLVRAIIPDHYYSKHKLIGKVRDSHPRIILPELSEWSGSGISALMQERIARYSKYDRKSYLPCSSNSLPGLTACWLSNGESAIAEQIISALKSAYMQVARNNESYGNMWEYAFAYDFIQLYPGLKNSDRYAIEARIRGALRHALLLLEGDNMSLWHGRATLSAMAWLSAIVLDQDNPEDLQLMTQAQGHFLETLKALSTTEAWPEGYNYWVNERALLIALATSAYLNGLEAAENSDEIRETLRRVGYWHIYNTRPDNRAQGFGDEGPRVDLKDETRRVIDLITQATEDPLLAAYSRYLGELYGYASYYQGYRWGFRLFNNPAVTPLPQLEKETLSFADDLPNTALFGKGAMNMAYMRSGWSPLDTFISFRAGNNFTHHGHYDAGHFTLFKGAPLATNSGTYGNFFSDHRLNYSLRTVSKNSLLILRPDEEVKPNRFFKENVSAGGQRITLPTGSAISNTTQWIENLNKNQHLEGGQLLAFDSNNSNYHYIAADLTPAYNSTLFDDNGDNGKVESVVRELFYLVETDQLFIHDKVISTDPSYTKKWLLHTINRPTLQQANLLLGSVNNGILESHNSSVLIQNGPGRLRLDRLYPNNATIRLIGGPDFQFYVESDGDDTDLDGVNMATGANKQAWFEDSQWRVEIQPAAPNLEDHYLIALTPTLNEFSKIEPSVLELKGENAYGVRSQHNLMIFIDGATEQALSFARAPGDSSLYLIGLKSGANVHLSSEGQKSTYAISDAGVTVIPLKDKSVGNIQLSW